MTQVARRKVCDFYRKACKHELVPLDLAQDALQENPIEQMAEAMDLRRAIQCLHRADQELMFLVFSAQLTYQEIAEILEIPVGTVKSRVSALKTKLRTLCKEGEAP
jgi:RNA polymerase sigma-70 factor (ECF subfamily)